MFFTGYLSSTGSYSVSLPWSGVAYWALLRPTSEIFAIPLQAPEVAVLSDQWNEWGTLCPFCLFLTPRNIKFKSVVPNNSEVCFKQPVTWLVQTGCSVSRIRLLAIQQHLDSSRRHHLLQPAPQHCLRR